MQSAKPGLALLPLVAGSVNQKTAQLGDTGGQA
jgi:hypothetical protein